MTIGHAFIRQMGDGEAYVFAALGGFTCSICAPASWDKEKVEQLLCDDLGEDGWQAIDKSTLGLGSSTPNPCNQDPKRWHWFMMRNP